MEMISEHKEFHLSANGISPEIVEISEDKLNTGGEGKDVYVAVGRDDMDVLTWALKNAVFPGSGVYLIHVFPPLNSIPTPVGRLSKNQVSGEQFQTYVNEENHRRRNILHKYIRLCADSKVAVDTILIESDQTAKAIVDLIPVLSINRLIVGTKRSSSRRLRRSTSKGGHVQKNAPDSCEVTIVCGGKRIAERNLIAAAPPGLTTKGQGQAQDRAQFTRPNFLYWVCFTGKTA